MVPEIDKPVAQGSLEKQEVAEKKLEEIEKVDTSSMADFFPGQMREIESATEEQVAGPKPEEGVVELGADLKVTESAGESPGEEVVISKETVVPDTEPVDKSKEEREASPKDICPDVKKEPSSIAKQVESVNIEAELSKGELKDLKKEEILALVNEIEGRLKRLREMVKELKQKLES